MGGLDRLIYHRGLRKGLHAQNNTALIVLADEERRRFRAGEKRHRTNRR